jgi:hypothetical protein
LYHLREPNSSSLCLVCAARLSLLGRRFFLGISVLGRPGAVDVSVNPFAGVSHLLFKFAVLRIQLDHALPDLAGIELAAFQTDRKFKPATTGKW